MNAWAAKWGIPAEAMRELMAELNTEPGLLAGATETAVQGRIMLAAAQRGARLWRNNVGAYVDKTGRMVRYGLCNSSKKLNDSVKSSDTIGLRPVLITAQHVGTVIGQFMAVEVKKGDWKPGLSARELAQAKFMQIVRDLGGVAGFSTGALPW